jgi:hypothetical protein
MTIGLNPALDQTVWLMPGMDGEKYFSKDGRAVKFMSNPDLAVSIRGLLRD